MAEAYTPGAFQRVTCRLPNRQDLCHFGGLGYNALRGPGQAQMDFSLYKNFAVTERYRVQFRWEAFNVFNPPFFSNPGLVPAGLSQARTAGAVPRVARMCSANFWNCLLRLESSASRPPAKVASCSEA